MEKQYMIVQITKIISEDEYCRITTSCYEPIESGYYSLEVAYEVKSSLSNPSYYIVIEYWT